MTKTTPLENIEKEYKQAIQNLLDAGSALDPNNLIKLSSALYSEIKAKKISTHENAHNDMLLFQYGVYDWGNELGKHFTFDITRQFIDYDEEDDQEMFQLSISLIYQPTIFEQLGSYSSWSSSFKSIDEWIENIKVTKGYQLTQSLPPNTYTLIFTQV